MWERINLNVHLIVGINIIVQGLQLKYQTLILSEPIAYTKKAASTAIKSFAWDVFFPIQIVYMVLDQMRERTTGFMTFLWGGSCSRKDVSGNRMMCLCGHRSVIPDLFSSSAVGMCGTFVSRWNYWMLTKKKHTIHGVLFSDIVDSLETNHGRYCKTSLSSSDSIFISPVMQKKRGLSWNPESFEDLGCTWVSASIRKQAEGMWKCEAIWLLVHSHTGSRGQREPSEYPAPAGNIWSHPSNAWTCVFSYLACLWTRWQEI